MKHISSLGSEEARSLRGLLFDLDDTVLSHGLLTEAAYGALWRLRAAGLELAAVTGRPSGWGDVLGAAVAPLAGCITGERRGQRRPASGRDAGARGGVRPRGARRTTAAAR